MIKKKFFGLLLTLSLVFCLGLFCTSYTMAYTIDEFLDYTEQLIDNSNTNSKVKELATIIHNNKTTIKNLVNTYAPSSTSFMCYFSNYTDKYYGIFLNNTTLTVNSSSSGIFLQSNLGKIRRDGANNLSYSSINGSGRYQYDICYGLMVTNDTVPERYYINTYVPPPVIYFTPRNDATVSIGNNNNVNCVKYGFSISQWKLGTATNFDELYYYEFSLYDNNADIYIGSASGGSSTTNYNNNALFYTNDNLYVYSRYIRYGQLYWLHVLKYTDRNTFTEENHWFTFVAPNATINNGVIVNVGSGDYNIQDSTNDIIQSVTEEGDVDNVLNEYLPSGDITDIATSNFEFTLLDNPFSTFLWHLLDSVYGALVDRGNVKLVADYKTLHFELNSDDFTLPDSNLKTFIRTVLIFIYIYGNYKYFHYLISLLETANINRAIAELGTDEFYDSDIM